MCIVSCSWRNVVQDTVSVWQLWWCSSAGSSETALSALSLDTPLPLGTRSRASCFCCPQITSTYSFVYQVSLQYEQYVVVKTLAHEHYRSFVEVTKSKSRSLPRAWSNALIWPRGRELSHYVTGRCVTTRHASRGRGQWGKCMWTLPLIII